MKNKIIDIIDTLVCATENGMLVWIETNARSTKRSYYREMHSFGEDGTKFEIEIKYMLIAEQWVLEKEPSLTLKNPELPGGIYYIYGGRYDMSELRDMVKKKNCADLDPKIEDVEKKLESICRNISLSTYRDTKIDKII